MLAKGEYQSLCTWPGCDLDWFGTDQRLALIWNINNTFMINTLSPRRNGHNFPDDIFKGICLHENDELRLRFHWRLFLSFQSSIFATLVQTIAWRWPGDKPLSEAMVVSLLAHVHYTRPQWVNSISLSQKRLPCCLSSNIVIFRFIPMWCQAQWSSEI